MIHYFSQIWLRQKTLLVNKVYHYVMIHRVLTVQEPLNAFLNHYNDFKHDRPCQSVGQISQTVVNIYKTFNIFRYHYNGSSHSFLNHYNISWNSDNGVFLETENSRVRNVKTIFEPL
jgi:hypothetical protein